MDNIFISFANILINTRYIRCFKKRKGANDYSGKFSITVFIEGHYSSLNEWYDSEEERNNRYLELRTILKVG